jgi:hypothetical protein
LTPQRTVLNHRADIPIFNNKVTIVFANHPLLSAIDSSSKKSTKYLYSFYALEIIMAKSKIQYQKGFSLFELTDRYGTEEQCEKALLNWRWPQGFMCAKC